MIDKWIYEDALNDLRTMQREYDLKNYNQVEPQINCDFIEKLIKRHFELVEVLKEIGWDGFNVDELKTIIKAGQYNAEKLNSLRNPQPYKFEDLIVGMWVYDTKREYEDYSFIKITKILSKEDCEHLYHDKNKKVFFDNVVCHAREFEEGRFFPVWYANVGCDE